MAELSEDYTVEIPKMANPKILMVGMLEKYLDSEENFIDRIKRQSNLFGTQDFDVKIIRKYIPRNKKLHNVILEVSPVFFKDIRKMEKYLLCGIASQCLNISAYCAVLSAGNTVIKLQIVDRKMLSAPYVTKITEVINVIPTCRNARTVNMQVKC